MTGDYAAIEIFSYKDFNQVGEFFGRLGMMYKLSDILKEITLELNKRSNGRIILCIENNFEKSIIENLLLDKENDFEQYIYKDGEKYGITTTRANRDLMISEMYNIISDNPKCLRSKELINETSSLEQRANGRIEAPRNSHDDCFFAGAFTAYVRRKTILTYMPLIAETPEKIEQEQFDLVKDVVSNNMMFDDPRLQRDMDYNFFQTEDDMSNPDNYTGEYEPYLIL